MHLIKRYTNRKLYDTTDKRYLTLDDIGELVLAGSELKVVDNETGIDMTSVTLSQVVLEREKRRSGTLPVTLLTSMIRSGKDAAWGYVRRSITPRPAAVAAGRVVEEVLSGLVKQGKLSLQEARTLGNALVDRLRHAGEGLERLVDERTQALLARLDLPSREQVQGLADAMRDLESRLDGLPGRPAGTPNPAGETAKAKKASGS